jgi:hypothetical protein
MLGHRWWCRFSRSPGWTVTSNTRTSSSSCSRRWLAGAATSASKCSGHSVSSVLVTQSSSIERYAHDAISAAQFRITTLGNRLDTAFTKGKRGFKNRCRVWRLDGAVGRMTHPPAILVQGRATSVPSTCLTSIPGQGAILGRPIRHIKQSPSTYICRPAGDARYGAGRRSCSLKQLTPAVSVRREYMSWASDGSSGCIEIRAPG